jgi:hypothetical protein
MEALLIQLPKTKGQPHIYRRNKNMIYRSSVASPLASPLASYLASYLALPVDRNRNAAYSQQICLIAQHGRRRYEIVDYLLSTAMVAISTFDLLSTQIQIVSSFQSYCRILCIDLQCLDVMSFRATCDILFTRS